MTQTGEGLDVAGGSAAAVGSCVLCGAEGVADTTPCTACEALRVVHGSYRIGRQLGRGGTGVVHEAVCADTGQRLAVKVVSLADTRDFKVLELFERGTALLQGLDHPRFPRVLAMERDARGRYYQTRTLYEGGSLESRVRHDKVHFRPDQVKRLLWQLLEVIGYLHRRAPPLVHRDIKPSNVMFESRKDFTPFLVDFDSAAAAGPAGTGTTIVVSPGYSAPEQLAGETLPASDLYSLGMTMLFVCTHRDPTELRRERGVLDTGAALGSLDPATRRVIKRLCEPSLSARYADADEALLDLAAIPAPAPLATVGKGSVLTRQVTLFGASLFRIAVGVLLGAILLWFFLINKQQREMNEQIQTYRGMHEGGYEDVTRRR